MSKQSSLAVLVLVLVAQLSTSFASFAQNPIATASSPSKSWLDLQLEEDPDGIVELRLETDVKLLVKTKHDEAFQPATLTYKTKSGEERKAAAEIKARGKTRKDICLHPPIKLKIKKVFLKEIGLNDHNDMKVVWECKPSAVFEQYIYKEFLAYRLYNLITPNSFRVKMAKIIMVDPKNPDKPIEKLGFLVEDEKQLSERMKGLVMEERPKDVKQFLRQDYLNFSLFQYMIGNTDWAFGNIHNMRFVQLNESKKVVPVPYDFDYSGMVDAPYAVPHESLPIQDVRTRYFKGGNVEQPEALLLRKRFMDAKAAIMAEIEKFPYLDKFNKNDVKAYLEDFFKELEDEKRFLKAINP